MYLFQRFIIRAKHWELFLLWLALGILFSLATYVIHGQAPLGGYSSTLDFLLGALDKAQSVVVLIWSCAVGYFLNSISPKQLRLRPSAFFLAIAACFVLGYLLRLWGTPGSWERATFLAVAFICFGYILRFPSKLLMVAEYQEPARFPAYFAYFLAALFFPIGIWFLQPRVNELLAAHRKVATPAAPVASVPALRA